LKHSILPLTLALTLTGLTVSASESDRPAKPNIVLILTDDLGWQDVKCYDIDEPSPMETPTLDALAKKGVLFWQAYSPAPVCAPSRAAILSGLHPARGEMTAVTGGSPPHPANPNAPSISPLARGVSQSRCCCALPFFMRMALTGQLVTEITVLVPPSPAAISSRTTAKVT